MKDNRRLRSEFYRMSEKINKTNKPDLPLASQYKIDGPRYLMLYWKESHELMMRLMKILEFSNLQDLRTIDDSLTEMGFITKEESK